MVVMNSLFATKHELLLEHTGLHTEHAHLVMAVLRTATMIDRDCTARLAEFDLTEARFAALLAASQGTEPGSPGSTPATIAEQLDVSRAAVTGLIDGLVRQGFAARNAHASDRRSLAVSITDAGRAAIDALRPVYGEWLGQLTRGLDATTASTALTALSTLQRNLTTSTASASASAH
ncbi:DNA-binding MarR family transcriptional regulator [Leucobacter luti]|nr:DNA-binding MarR family transcriptional regulator [Leucobacter luti]